jgi:hypothetical protein
MTCPLPSDWQSVWMSEIVNFWFQPICVSKNTPSDFSKESLIYLCINVVRACSDPKVIPALAYPIINSTAVDDPAINVTAASSVTSDPVINLTTVPTIGDSLSYDR